jgi:hypothetical protein
MFYMKKKFFVLLFLFCVFFIPFAYACGCGMAISDIKVFNALKETQAYLLIDVHDQNTYDEMPFFRMISMEEPYNVTIVFPIDGIPYDVDGRTITAGQFLEDYDINTAESYIMKQSFSGLVKRIGKDLGNMATPFFILSNGFLGFLGFFGVGASRISGAADGAFGGLGPVAHFEFEGGSMDIYDVDSLDTLEEFVETVNITLTGEVEELVTKYNDYYVAVLYLSVPSVLDADSRFGLELCPEKTERVKQLLQEEAVLDFEEIQELTGVSRQDLWELSYLSGSSNDLYAAQELDEIYSKYDSCTASLVKLIFSVNNVNENVNGTLVIMKFSGTNEFFYPTSIVNSYKYPINDQKYFIKTPASLHVDLSSSEVDKIASFDSQRWYKVSSTEEDIKGNIIEADSGVRTGDFFRSVNESLFNNSLWFAFIIIIVIIVLPFVFYKFKVNESLTGGEIGLAIGMILLGGLILSSIVMLVKKKKFFALTMFSLWIVLLLIMVLL